MSGEVSIITYADFGQNMGRYRTTDSANALLRYLWGQSGGVTIQYADGTESAPLVGGMINFTGVSDNGAFMSIGYNATASVQHNGVFGGSFTSAYIGWENSIHYQGIEYRIDNSETFLHSPHGGWDGGGHDYKVTRMSKVITDVIPATIYSGTSAEFANSATGMTLYHTGAGNMGVYDDGSHQWLAGAYTYLVGGADSISSAWTHGCGSNYSAEDAALYTLNTTYNGLSTAEPLPFEPQQGDSGSPVFIFNSNSGQYEYVGAVQSIGGGIANYRGGADYTKDVLGQYDKVVTADGTSTLHITAVEKEEAAVTSDWLAAEYGLERSLTVTPYSGTVTDDSGNELTSFVGVKSGINTWLDLSTVKDTDNWYNYENAYLNAAHYIEGSYATSGKELSYGDLFLTENLVFTATAATNNIVLDATVDLGIGYAQFSLGEGQSSASFNISSGGDGSYQFNHAGYVIDYGVSVHTTLTGSADHMYEWRKVGAGDLYIEGSGDNNILLNVGGAGKTFLKRTDGYAAYNALVNTYATVVISDVNQIYRDLTFGHQGGVLDFNGNSMTWNNDNAASADGFTIHALDDSAIIANLASGTTTTLTWTQSGNQTFLGSFADNGNDSAFKFVYNGGADSSLTLNSIKTHLTVAGSGMEVQSGKLVLVGTNTVHAPGSASGMNADRYTSAMDWHYADATSDVTVKNGATFELGSHARLTGNVTVESGGTFIMREGVQHEQEYIEGGIHLQNTADIAAFYGLKGNVSLASDATMQVLYNSGVTATGEYSGNITGAGNVSIDLGDKATKFILSGTNTFSGSKAVEQGVLIATGTAALGDVSTNKWVLGKESTLSVTSGLTADNALSFIDGSSSGTLALTQDMADVMDMSNHSTLFVGAIEGMVVQYGDANDTLTATTGGKWNLGGGGGELVVNAQLSGGDLVLGNGSGQGVVTLTNTNNKINSITFSGGVILNIESTSALGGASITLGYTSAMMTDSATAGLLALVNTSSDGTIMLDRAQNAAIDLSGHASLSLGSFGTTEYSGTITVANNAAYRFGGAEGKLVLTQALSANGTNALILDGQTYSGGALQLNAVSSITGAVSIMGYDSSKTSVTTGDMTLTFGVDNALSSVSGVTVMKGGILDVGSTTQTLKNLAVKSGGLLKGNEDGTLIFNMGTEVNGNSAYFQEGSMNLGKVEKIGAGELVLNSTDNTWKRFTINKGTVFTRVDNALSTTGVTRVEAGGVLNLNTWDGDGFRGRTLGGNIELGDGGVISVGTIVNEAVNTVTFNGSIFVDKGATGTINGGYWHVTGGANNTDGGTLAFNASALHLKETYAQSFGGTFDIASSSVSVYSDGSGDNMLKHFSHMNVGAGKSLYLEDATWNTIWQLDKLTGTGTVTWNSDTTHYNTARVLISGDGAFSGTINYNRSLGADDRTHQSFVEIRSESAVSGATLNMNGNANSFATLAVNADAVRLGGVNGDEYSHIMAGAAPTNAASTTAPASTRDATLILTGSGSYTYSGSIGTTADTASASLSLSMQGSGSQTINGTTVVLNDISALSGSLSVSANSFSLLGDVTVAQGATLKLGDAFSLDSGHTFYVQGSDNASTATFGSALTLNSGTLCFDASDLSTTSGTYSLALSTASGNATLNFNNSGSLSAGTYYLASGDWTGAALTMDAGMDFMSATINNSANGLTLTLAIHSDSDIWNGTDSAYGWSLYTFGSSSRSQLTGTAVFNDLAANKTVNVTETQNLKALRFDSKDDYAFSVASEKSVTATNLYQLGSGTTTLSGTVNVTSTMIEAGSLVVTGTAQSLGSVSGEGELVIDWGANTSGTVNISDLGTLHIKTGSYGSESAAAINVDTIIVDAGATYVQGANIAQTVNLQTAGTVSLSGCSNWNSLIGTVALTGDATFMNRNGFSFIAGGIQGNNHKLIIQGVFSTAAESTGLVLKAQASNISATEVQSGVLMLGGELYHDGTQMGTISVANGAALRMAYGTGLGNATIHLQSGAELQLYNGSGGSVELNGNLTVADGAKIRGAYYGGNARMTGTISGSGTLTLTNEQSHRYYINSSVKDAADAALALKIADGSNAANVQIGGSNTYSGGTTLESGSLTTANSSALGTGNVQINGGTLTLAENLSISTLNGSAGTLDFAGNTLTVGAHGASADASYSGALTSSVSTAGSITKQGSNTQSFTAADLELQDITVEAGTLSLSDVAAVAGNITVQDGASLSVADGSITLGEGQTLAVLSGSSGAVTLNALALDGGNIVLSASGLSADSAALTISSVAGDVATSITLAGMVDLADGKYLLAAGDWSAVEASLFSLGFMAKSAELNPSLSTDSQGLWLTLATASDDSSNVWAGTDSAYEWNSTTFSQYSTSDALAAEAIFDATAANKSVNVTSAVSTGTVTISSGGYSFSGGGSISTGTLSVSGGGSASSIANIEVSDAIVVDGSELTIVELSPTNPSAPIALSNAAKLTIGDASHRYGAFSGKVTGDDGSQLHLYTTQVSDTYWQQDGTVQLLDDSTVQDVYIHGDLALNIIAGSQATIGDKFTNVQGANLHMDAGSKLVVRAEEATALTPTTGNIVLAGDLNLVTYSPVTTATSIASDFVLADGATGTLIKQDSGSVTLSGNLNLSGVTVQQGTLKLTGANTATMVYSVSSGATLALSGSSTYSFDASAERVINGTLQIESDVNVSGTGRITIAGGGSIALADGASFNRTSGNGGAYWVQGALVALQDATADFTSVDDVHFHAADNGKIELKSGSTLNMQVKSLQYWRPADISLGANSTLNLTTTNGFDDSDGNGTPKIAISLAEGAAFNVLGGVVNINGSSSLSLGSNAKVNFNGGDVTFASGATLTMGTGSDLKVSSGTMKIQSDIGSADTSSAVTLAGGHLQLNYNGEQSVHSKLVVNNSAATADAPATSVLRNDTGAESLVRNLDSVEIASNNTLELQQASWNTIWNIKDLSGDGNLTWNSTTNHYTTSRLILSGDGSDFSGTVTVSRAYNNQSRPFQAYLELASNDAVKGGLVNINVASETPSGSRIALAVNTENAQMQGLVGNAYSHLYSGPSRTNADDTSVPGSTVANTLTIGGVGGTFAGTVGTAADTERLNLSMTGSGSQTFSGEAHVGNISVSAGSLVLSNAASTVSGDITVSGGMLDLDATYTLGTGQTLSVLTGTADSVQLAGLTLADGEMVFDASMLSGDTAALSVGTLTLTAGTQVINFTNTENLSTDTAYMLASGDAWAGLDMTKLTASGLGNSLYSFSGSDSGLFITLTGAASVWAGTDDSHAWNSTVFSTHDASVAAQKAVFDGTAANTVVQVTENVTTGEISIQGDKQYSFEGAGTVTTDVLNHEGTQSLWLYNGLTVNSLIDAADIDVAWGGVLNVNASGSIGNMILRANSTASSTVNLKSTSLSIAGVSLYNTSQLNFGVATGADAATYTVTGDITVQNNASNTNSTISVAEGATLTVQGTMDGDVGHTLTVDGDMVANALDYSSGTTAVNGSGSLSATSTKVSGGTVNLSTADSDLGAVTVSGGTLNISSAKVELSGLTTSGGSVAFASADATVGDIDMQNASSIVFNLAAGATSTTYTVGEIKTSSSDNFQRNISIASGVALNATKVTNGWGIGTLDVDGALNVDGLFKFATGNNTNTITGDGMITVGSAEFSNHGVYDISVHQMTVKGELKLLADWGDRNMTLSGGTLTVQGAINMTDNDSTRRLLYISGGNLELQGGGTISGGVLTLSSGAFKQQGGNTTISNTLNLKGGALNVEGGKLTLSSTPTISLADGTTAAVTVSGGTLDLTKGNAAVLMGTTGVNFTLSGGTLDLADQTFTAGTVGDAITLASTSGLNLNSGTLALGNLTAGTYYLFNSGAEDVWDSLSADNVTINGESALRYGASVGYSTVDGVTYASITTTNDSGNQALVLYWDGGATGTWDDSQAVWNVVETLDGAMTDFNAGDSVVFNTSATVTLAADVTADSVTLVNPAASDTNVEGAPLRVSLDESAGALTADSIVVGGGTVLAFETAKAGYTAENISGSGTVELNLTNADNSLKLGENFTGETYVKSGKLNVTADSKVGAILHLADGVNMKAEGIERLDFDIVLDGATSVENGGHTHFYGAVSGDGTFKHANSNGYFSFWEDVNLGGLVHASCNEWGREMFEADATIGIVDLNGGHVYFKKNSTIGSLTLSSNASTIVEFQATGSHTIDAVDISGGTVNFNGMSTIDAADISGGTVNFTNTADIANMNISGGTVKFTTDSVGSAGRVITMTGGTLELNKAAANAEQVLYSSLVVNNASATAESPATSVLRNDLNEAAGNNATRTLNSIEIAANNTLELQQNGWNTIWNINSLSGEGNLVWKSTTTHSSSSMLVLSGDNEFSGQIVLNRTPQDQWTNGAYQACVVLASDGAAKNATLSLQGHDDGDGNNQSGKGNNATLTINTANATVQGVNGNELSHIYAGEARTSVTQSDTAPGSTVANTLTIAGAGGSFAGTVGTAADSERLNLAMTGSGTQTFSGAAHVGNITVEAGELVLSHADSTVSGDVTVNAGGSLTLAALTLGSGQTLSVLTADSGAVSVVNLTLSGGALAFDASLLTADSAALSLTGALTMTDGAAYSINVGDALSLTSSGSYMLASGDWSAAAADGISFTVNGLEYGSTGTVNATADGLYLVYNVSNIHTWTGDAGDGTWGTANWDTTPADDTDGSVEFGDAVDAIAVFRMNAAVNATDAVTVGTVSILEGAQVNLGISGEGASFSAGEILVENGKLTIANSSNMTGIGSITVTADGVLELAYGSGINNAADANTTILLQGGTINLMNGAGSYHELEADITVDGSGFIHGSVYGNVSVISGGISGSGELTFDALVIPNDGTYRNTVTVSSTISDAASGSLALHIGNADVVLSGTNSYTGGTSIEEDGKLTITAAQAIGGSSGKLGTLSGNGTFVINLGIASDVVVAYDSALGEFTGVVDIQQGALYVGNLNTENTGRDAVFNAERVVVHSGAQFITHLGGSGKTLSADVDLMSGATFGNRDGHIAYDGDIRFNLSDATAGTFNENGTVSIYEYWSKTLTFNGVLSGQGTVELGSSVNEDGGSAYVLTNGDNTFSGTYKLMDGNAENRPVLLVLQHQNAAQYATITLAGSSTVSTLRLDTDATIAALNSTDADNVVTTSTVATLTVSSGAFAGKLQNGSAANVLSLTKQGSGTLTLSGANSYTGATTVSAGTLELAGTVSMNAASAITVNSGATLLLNANSQTMSLGNAVSGEGTIHKKGSYETVLTGDVDVLAIEVKDGEDQDTNAGTLTLTGSSVKADNLYAAYGQVNIGAEENGNTFMTVDKVELGDSFNGSSTIGLAIRKGSTLSVTGNNNGSGNGGNPHKNASLLVSEWGASGTLDIQGTLLVQNANASLGDDASVINIDGGTMAVAGIAAVRADTGAALTLNLSGDGKLILGANGVSTPADASINLGAGTVGMSAATTEIAENVSLNSTEGTTFDTTQYAYETNAEGVATDIVRGDEGGDMVLSGDITSADGVAASMRVTGAGTLHVAGSADVRGNVTVEQGAGMAVSTVADGTAASMATISSADGSNAASISGGVRLSHADAAVSIVGSGMDITEISNSLIALQQGVSLNMNNLHIAAGTQVQGYHAATAASGVMLLDGEVTRNDVALADVSLEISKANAVRGADGANTQAAKVMMLSSSAFSYSSLTGTLTVEFSGEFAHELLAGGYDAVGLSFTETEFDTTAITIVGMYEGISGSVEGYFDTSAGGNAVVYFSTDIIPEPATSTLGLLALAALAYRRRRK